MIIHKGKLKKLERSNIVALKTSIMHAKQKLENKKGKDFIKSKITAIAIKMWILMFIAIKISKIKASKSINANTFIIINY